VTHSDNLYAQTRKLVEAFKFDDSVARVFTDMINRSVPGYPMMLDMLGVLTENIIQDHSLCYDLGCSLGASTLAIRQNIHQENCRIIAIDNSPAMIERCQQVIQQDSSITPVLVQNADILDIAFQPCQLVSMNLTLQFIDPAQRLRLLSDIAHSLNTGGALFLSEKIRFDDELEQNALTELHHQFKKHQGYSELEIAQKRTAIENVLVPESIATHRQRLLDAGFSRVIIALQCFNFVAFIAYK
jgi:tRNA (cmo5U34)-methyltransferase